MSKIRKSSYFVPDPIYYTRAAVATIGIQSETNGCFAHALQVSQGCGYNSTVTTFDVAVVYTRKIASIFDDVAYLENTFGRS